MRNLFVRYEIFYIKPQGDSEVSLLLLFLIARSQKEHKNAAMKNVQAAKHPCFLKGFEEFDPIDCANFGHEANRLLPFNKTQLLNQTRAKTNLDKAIINSRLHETK